MDNAESAVLVGGIIAIVGVLWFFFGASEEKMGASNATSAPVYACHMHPWITSEDAAATCSVCGMKLTLQGDQPTS